MRLRTLDAAGRRAYLNEIRPRILTLQVRAGRVDLRWWLPAWALEEPLRFVLRTAPLAARWLPALARRVGALASRAPELRTAPAPAGVRAGATSAVAGTPGDGAPADPAPRLPWWDGLDELFSESHRDLLLLPDGAPLLNVAAGNASVVIEEVRLRRRTRGGP